MTTAEQARAEAMKAQAGISSILYGFREKTGLRIDRIEICDVVDGSGKVVDQHATVEVRL